MNDSKNILSLLTVTLVIALVATSPILSASHDFSIADPPTLEVWDIVTVEIIENTNILINDTVNLKSGNELRIINSTVTFQLNSTVDEIKLNVFDGANLYIENSNITVTDMNYVFVIDARANGSSIVKGSNITIIDSRIENAELDFVMVSSSTSAELLVSGSTFYNLTSFKAGYFSSVDLQYNTFTDYVLGIELDDNTGLITIAHNTFTNVDTGFDVDDSVEIMVDDNDFTTIAVMGFKTDDTPLVYAINNVFTMVEIGLFVDDARDGVSLDDNVFDQIYDIGIKIDDLNPANISGNTFTNAAVGLYSEQSRTFADHNVFQDCEVAVVLYDSDFSRLSYNNYTSITDVAIEALNTRVTYIFESRFIDSPLGLDLYISPLDIYDNVFENLENGIYAFDSDSAKIHDNSFYNITETAIEIDDSREFEISDNVIELAEVGINIVAGRSCLVQSNVLNFVLEGISVVYSRGVSVLGNTVNNTVTGFYFESTKEMIATANGAINAQYGITLWSMTAAVLASNGVFDSVYGLSIWFSEDIRLTGNEVSTSDIGIIARNSLRLQIRDGTYSLLDIGIQVLGSYAPQITGNTFVDIANEAITLIDSDSFRAYHNNFYTVGDYADIQNCLGHFYLEVNNVTFEGNYYQGVSNETWLIDTVLIDLVSHQIIDMGPLDQAYTVKPTIEYITRDITNPTDLEPVTVESQVFVPQQIIDNGNWTVYLQYMLINETSWRAIDMGAGVPVGSIGSINLFSGTISALPYDFEVLYRIMVQYEDAGNYSYVYSYNTTYDVTVSDLTPMVIYDVAVKVISYNEEAEQDYTVPTNVFYEDVEFIIFCKITNNTDIQMLAGRRHVNLTWTEIDPNTNDTVSFTGLMDYNSTSNDYNLPLGKSYPEGFIVTFFISVIGSDSTYYRTVVNQTLVIELPPEATAFDTQTLLTIGGMLLLVQAIVVIRRRRKKEE